jgi:probable rRNA maturation factor
VAADVVGVALEGAGDRTLAAAVEGWALALLAALRGEGALGPEPTELSLVLCDDAFIRPLNATWREHDAATDVLSFPLDEPDHLGDVVVSLETAGRRLSRDWALEDEVLFLLIHGLLHLLGHDHQDEDERRTMEAAEQRLWTALGRVGTLREP